MYCMLLVVFIFQHNMLFGNTMEQLNHVILHNIRSGTKYFVQITQLLYLHLTVFTIMQVAYEDLNLCNSRQMFMTKCM